MTIAEIKDAYAELGKQQRGTFLVAAVIALLSLLMLISAAIPAKAEVTSTNYQVGGGSFTPPPGANIPPGASNTVPGFLTAQFDLKINKKFKGQVIDIRRVTFYDEKGKRLGEVAVENINRRLRIQPTTTPIPGRPSTNEQFSLTVEPVQGKMHLWPLEEGIVNFNAVARRNFGVKAGQKIYAVVSGKSGIRGFEIKAPTSEARGFGF